MVPDKLRMKIVVERIRWTRSMLSNIRSLPLNSFLEFTADPHVPAAAESYLRRSLEALLDLGRHILAKGFGRAVSEYKAIAGELEQVGVLDGEQAARLREIAGYRNRLVHFYDEIQVEELFEICTGGLPDVELLLESLERWVREHPEMIDRTL